MKKTGEEPLWTSRVFSGMTTFNISTIVKGDIMSYLDMVIKQWLPRPISIIFVTMLGLYILLISLGVSHWLALIGAIGYGLSSNLIISIVAGHNTKVITIGYMAMAIGGSYLVYKKKFYRGAFIVALSSGLMLKAGHYQIIYYFLLFFSCYGCLLFDFSYQRKNTQ